MNERSFFPIYFNTEMKWLC